MEQESTQNQRALAPAVLREMMADVKRRLDAAKASRVEEEEVKSSVVTGQSLRETEEQLYRVFQLFDPKNTKFVPMNELLLLLRAVAIDIDETLLGEILNKSFSEQERTEITAANKINFDQFLNIVKFSGGGSRGKQEARRVFETVVPKGVGALPFDTFRTVLKEADARITDGELEEIYRYCSLSGHPNGLTLSDFEEVAEFVHETH